MSDWVKALLPPVITLVSGAVGVLMTLLARARVQDLTREALMRRLQEAKALDEERDRVLANLREEISRREAVVAELTLRYERLEDQVISVTQERLRLQRWVQECRRRAEASGLPLPPLE